MANLILSMDGLVLKEIELDKERVTIGRRPHNDVQINNLAISGEHAVVVTILDDSFLEDLNSTNGTLVNGKPIKKRVLHHNDVITLGKYTLKFLNDPKEKSAAEGRIEMDGSLDGGYTKRSMTSSAGVTSDSDVATASSIGTATAFSAGASAGTTSDPSADETVRMEVSRVNVGAEHPGTESEIGAHAVLLILSGSNKGKELSLLKAITTLGKPGVQVATIVLEPQGYVLQHIEGAQQPLVNGKPIGDEPWLLNDGEEVEIYGVHMRFLLRF
ncbi:MAG: FHA domain-containing protein [Zoogloeaceae bacterium]|jgi:pSer/pThr/pTyr-binding forkhead associated (FHA) protein|nr:FHA domain-containing protein [Zoogloeaceae bacterium]